MSLRLNIGCGPIIAEGWENLDRNPGPGVTQTDVLAWDGEILGADGAVAHHVLQMVAWPDLIPWLENVRRALEVGGWLRLSVPDLEQTAAWLGYPDYGPGPPISDDHETSRHGKVCLWVSQAGATRSVFTADWLVELCGRAGFSFAARAPYRATHGPEWLTELDDRPNRCGESVYVDARR